MNYFQTKLSTVSINNVEYENVQVVSDVRFNTETIPQGYIEVPNGYEALDILGCAYFPNAEVLFRAIDVKEEPKEPTQLDTIEANTSYLVMMSE